MGSVCVCACGMTYLYVYMNMEACVCRDTPCTLAHQILKVPSPVFVMIVKICSIDQDQNLVCLHILGTVLCLAVLENDIVC